LVNLEQLERQQEDAGRALIDAWQTCPVELRSIWIRRLKQAAESDDELAAIEANEQLQDLFNAALEHYGTPFGLWRDDPVGFIRDVLDEGIWRRQQEIAESVRDHPFTAVPSCFASGKTHLDARLAIWWVLVHAPGTAIVVTTASRMRQVITQLWPHIRRAHAMHDLPGKVDSYQWKMLGLHGQTELVAYGFTPPAREPDAVQGVHAPHVLIIIDEAGLINPLTGQAWLSASTGDHTRVLATGNPPTAEEGSWLQLISESENWNCLPIPAQLTPNWTGEDTDQCKSCADWRQNPHQIGIHLIKPSDAQLFANDYGEDSAFYKAKVNAEFTKGAANKAIPANYAEATWWRKDNTRLPDHLFTGGGDLDIDHLIGPRARIRLGVDTAQGGADRMVIARNVGRLISVVFEEQGDPVRNTFACAGYVKEQIEEARKLEQQLGPAVDEHKNLWGIDVVIDATGDRGPVDTLQAWNDEGLLGRNVNIIPVNFGEAAEDPKRYYLRRSEMWWNLRELLNPARGESDVYLDVDRSVIGEMCEPKYTHNNAGKIVLESKDDLRDRGKRSPDHADAIALSVYDPLSLRPKRKPRKTVWGTG
jgi:hypothetical protein